MTGTSGVRLDTGRAPEGPTTQGKGPSGGNQHAAARFGAVLARLSAKPDTAPVLAGETPPRPADSATARKAGSVQALGVPAMGLHPAKAEDDANPLGAFSGIGHEGETVQLAVLDMPPTGERLTEGVAGQILAALDGDLHLGPKAGIHAGPAPAAPTTAIATAIATGRQIPGTTVAQPTTAGAALSSSEVAIATPGSGQPAKATITRNETHFAPILHSTAGLPADSPPIHRAVKDGGGARRPAAVMPDTAGQRGGQNPSPDALPPTAPPDGSAGAHGTMAGPATAPQTGGALPGFSAASASDIRQADMPPPPARIASTHVAVGQGPARVLHIRLHPAELGTVTVRMRASDAGLEIHIEASRQETLALLQRDRGQLASILRHAGDTPENVTLSLADRAVAAPQPAGQDGWQQAMGDSRQGAMPGGSHNQEPGQERGQPGTPAAAQDDTFDEQVRDDSESSAETARPHGALYL